MKIFYVVSHTVEGFDIAALIATVQIAKVHDFDCRGEGVFRDFHILHFGLNGFRIRHMSIIPCETRCPAFMFRYFHVSKCYSRTMPILPRTSSTFLEPRILRRPHQYNLPPPENYTIRCPRWPESQQQALLSSVGGRFLLLSCLRCYTGATKN